MFILFTQRLNKTILIAQCYNEEVARPYMLCTRLNLEPNSVCSLM